MRALPLLICLGLAGIAHPLPAQEILDPVKQKAIWDAEHITFKMEKRFGERFLAALKEHDAAGIAGFLHPDATGAIIASNTPIDSRNMSLVTERKRSGSASPAKPKAIVAAIVSPFAPITAFTSARLRVLKINALPADGDLEQWQTELLISATGSADDGTLYAIDSKHDTVFRIPTDTDFASGPAIQSWNIKSEDLRHAERMLMEEVTVAMRLGQLPLPDNWKLPPGQSPHQFTYQIAVEDYDNDGFLDIALATMHGATVLLKSVHGKGFGLANGEVNLPMSAINPLHALATWIDFNNDGHPDLILGDRTYKNIGGTRFEEITATCGLTFTPSAMGCTVADYDGDGFLDLYVLYQANGGAAGSSVPWVGDDTTGAPNVLWRNRGDGTFEDVTEKANAGCGARNSFAAAWFHADDDHFPDLYVANDFGSNNLLRNRGDGTFEDIANTSGVADFATSMGVTSGDLDNDGAPELYVANMYSKMGRRIIGQVQESDYDPGIYEQIKGACAGNRLYRRDSTTKGVYLEHSEAWGINNIGWAYAPAMADFNNDGFLDLHATTGFMSFERGKPDG
jgi:hypothetical protein